MRDHVNVLTATCAPPANVLGGGFAEFAAPRLLAETYQIIDLACDAFARNAVTTADEPSGDARSKVAPAADTASSRSRQFSATATSTNSVKETTAS